MNISLSFLFRNIILLLTICCILPFVCLSQTSSNSKKTDEKNVNNYYKAKNAKKDYSKSASLKITNKDYAGAKADYQKALADYPNNAKIHFNYAMLLTNYFSDFKTARKHYEMSLALNPNDPKVHFIYAFVLKLFLNNNQSARIHYQTATKLKNSYISRESDKLFGIKR